MSFQLPNVAEKLGPLPIWAWIGVAAGVGFLLTRHGVTPQINPNTTLAGAAPGSALDGSALPSSYDPIAQITAMSSANVAQSQAQTAQTSTFVGNILDLLKGAPNAPNEFTASLPTGGTISFGNDVPTFGNIGTGNGLVSGLEVQGKNANALAATQGFWGNQDAYQQGYWANQVAGTQGFWGNQDVYQQGFWANQLAGTQAAAKPPPAAQPSPAPPPPVAGGNPPGNNLTQAPPGNYSAIRAQCQPGNYSCAHAVAPWLGNNPVW